MMLLGLGQDTSGIWLHSTIHSAMCTVAPILTVFSTFFVLVTLVKMITDESDSRHDSFSFSKLFQVMFPGIATEEQSTELKKIVKLSEVILKGQISFITYLSGYYFQNLHL